MKLFPRLYHVPPAAYALAAFLLAAAVQTSAVHAQDMPAPAGAQERSSPFGIGFQSSWPAYGLSGLYDVNDKITAQLVVGALGSWTTVTGRGLYHFSQQEKYNIYGFGSAGMYRYSFRALGASESESSLIVGGGAGMEFPLRKLFNDEDFPPLYWSFDLGFSAGSFEHYNWSGFIWGGGIHYRF
jgi:hypothetical protein